MIETMLVLLALALPADRAEADRLFDAADYSGARAAYEALLPEAATGAERSDLLTRIGLTHLLEGRYWDAEAALSKAIEEHETAEARLQRGRAYFYAGVNAAADPTAGGAGIRSLMNDAAREMERALALSPEWAFAWDCLAYVERYREDPEAEERAFRRALELDPRDPDAALQVAWFEEQAGHADRARELLSSVPAELRTASHWKGLGRLAAAAGDTDAAVAAWRAAVAAAPDDAEAYLGLWNATGRQKRFAEFDRDMREILAARPDLWLPEYYLGFSLRYDGKPEEALTAFLHAQERSGDDVRPLAVAVDVLLLDLKREDEAIAKCEDLLTRDPGNARALQVLNALAYQKAQERDFPAAEKLFTLLSKADPGNWSHATNLALIMKETDRVEEAIALYRKTAERHPFEPQILNDLGLLFMGQGRKEEGEGAFREALERDPEFLDSLENLGAFARLEGRLAEAKSFFLRAYERVRREGGDLSKFRRYLDMVAREIEESR